MIGGKNNVRHTNPPRAAQAPKKSHIRTENAIAIIAITGIAAHLVLRFLVKSPQLSYDVPLFAALILGGTPLVYDLGVKTYRREFGSDLLAGISIVVSVILGEYLAGTLVVLMLSGGNVLEAYAVRSASSVLEALAKRVPSVAHRKQGSAITDVPLDKIRPGDVLTVFPHEICPVDGVVIAGEGIMDESYLTGEPFEISKTPGAQVLSGAINGASALTIQAEKLAIDSRYARIMGVMKRAQENRPRIRRLGDQLGAYYTPIAVAVAIIAWASSGDAVRFLAVLVVATPCPLLIAIPVSIIGSISLAARRGIVVKDPSVLEQLDTCRTIIFDKTGTLTYGLPHLTQQIVAPGFDKTEVLQLVASVEQYSKHPLARAILNAARESGLGLDHASEISEAPGGGLRGMVRGRAIRITSRPVLLKELGIPESIFPLITGGLTCEIALDGIYAATYVFHDAPRTESKPFIQHLGKKHGFDRLMLVSGDRESEVKYLADLVGVKEVYASQSPEEKVELVRKATQEAKTLFLGDGINDAPALMTASIGIAFGHNSDITTESAGAVIMDTSLEKVDEFFHIARRMRTIALQSAIGGMVLSMIGMVFAAAGYLPPVAGAICQEAIDLLAILNAIRAAFEPRSLIDF
ncbi:MAG: heavy metal translocating P-type ATPase [Acidobacteria bacterium]|nr:MAG: heavy metal translocating P-type ATPase [Acidobacteriota bacterium]